MSRSCVIPLEELLDLVNCAESYGFKDDVFLDTLAGWAGAVTDAEIAAYAAQFLLPSFVAQGYGEEDRVNSTERLTEWRDKYVAGRANAR